MIEFIRLGVAAVVLLFMAGLAALILYYIAIRRIDISRLISEPTGDASMSRFQLLIFTFVVAMSLFLVVVGNGAFPDQIPGSVLALLGISASSYLVSKGIQFSDSHGITDKNPPPNPPQGGNNGNN